MIKILTDEQRREAALLLTQALDLADRIERARPVAYADIDTNWRRNAFATRKYTLKDARAEGKLAAMFLRQAWEILDPSLPPFKP